VTRTLYFGDNPSLHKKRCYTQVLRGHIALAKAAFPPGTPGHVLDVLARQFLWHDGLNYNHGTGHGVGAALNVHEGPQRISPHYENAQPLEIGMVVSNEPGYYEEGNFGVRIENLQVVIDKQTPFRFGSKDKRGRDIPYFGFGPLTLVPFAKNLINLDLMSEAEIRYVDAYHGTCWDKVSPLLEGEAKEWLKRNTTRFVPYTGYMGAPFPTEMLGDYH